MGGDFLFGKFLETADNILRNCNPGSHDSLRVDVMELLVNAFS